jgi:menaquinone-specific isochorismate synthase
MTRAARNLGRGSSRSDPVGELSALIAAERARLAPDAFCAASIAVRPAPSEALLALSQSSTAVFWSPPQGTEFTGIDSAVELAAKGARRFSDIVTGARQLLARVQSVAAPGSLSPLPRLFGGFAFQTGRANTPLWQPFGEARFVLPRLLYTRHGDDAWLTLTLHADETHDEERLESLLAQSRRVLDALRPNHEKSMLSPAPRLVDVAERSQREWAECVAAIRDGIESGRFEKVVAAGCSVLTLDPAPDASSILCRLRAQDGACTRFAFRAGSCIFLGASPERLIDKKGLRVETEAMAGSIRAGNRSGAGQLLASRKDLDEHDIVVRELVRCLEPFAARLEYAPRPEVHQLRYVLHLRTPIVAELSGARHILELVERVHPTPAVGGVPRNRALEWIAEHEPAERGWYAGPVGWFDAAGDGQFWVALRSALIAGEQAHLYAGAGIVRDSDPESEYAETRLKLASLLAALQVTS